MALCSDCPGGSMCCMEDDDTHWKARGDETYWGEPTSDAERKLCAAVGDSILFDVLKKGV
jgi:hypothetical protein